MLAQNVSPVLKLKTYVGKTETLLNLFSLKLCYNDLALVRLTADLEKPLTINLSNLICNLKQYCYLYRPTQIRMTMNSWNLLFLLA